MIRRFRFFLFSLIFLAPTLSIVAQEPDPSILSSDAIIARVNGKPILLSQLREAALDLDVPISSLTTGGIEGEGFRKAVTLLIDEELLVQEARKLELTTDETELTRRVDELIQRLVKRLGGETQFAEFLKKSHLSLAALRSAMLDRERRQDMAAGVVAARIKLNSAEVDAFRRKREEAGEAAEEALVAHILIRCLPSERDLPIGKKQFEKALGAAKEAGKDKALFGKLAHDISEDPATRERGGVLGWVNPTSLSAALSSRLSTMEEGEVSEPVASDQGWHVLYLIERHSPRDLLFGERFTEERTKLLEALRTNAVVEIYPLN